MARTVYYGYGVEAGKTARYQGLAESSVDTDVHDYVFEMGEKFTARREADYRLGYAAGYAEADEWLSGNAADCDEDDDVDVMAEVNAAALADAEADDERYAML